MDLLNSVWHDLHDTMSWKAYTGTARNVMRDHYSVYRRLFSQARPFSIDNKALELAYDLSLEEPRKVTKRLMLARLPFPKTWIEIDFIHKTKYSAKKGHASPVTEDTPLKIGWLLQEAPDDPQIWFSTSFAHVPDHKPANTALRGRLQTSPSIITFLVDTLNRKPPVKIGQCEAMNREFLMGMLRGADGEFSEEIGDGFRHIGWGYGGGAENLTPDQAMRSIAVPLDLENSINIGLTPLARSLMPHVDLASFNSQIINSAVESRGDVRLIVALLSLINEVPIIQEFNRPSGRVSMGGQLKPYLQNSRVTINIPTKRYKGVVRNILKTAAAAAKARHEVRGHWRTIIHKKAHERKVKKPDGSIGRVYIAAGELERVWVKSHERGDARLGYVRHTYEVEKRVG